MIEDAELEPSRLRELAAGLLGDPERLARDGRRLAGLARPDAAERVAGELLAAIGASWAGD